MLSFLREQRFEDLSARRPTISSGNSPDNSNEEIQEQEYLTVTSQDKNVRKSTILLAILFGVGLLCLWFMIKKSTPRAASAAVVSTEEAQIEKAITRLTGVKSEMFNRMDEIVKKFYEFSDVQQVNIGELAKNPFKHEIFLSALEGKSDAEGSDFDIDSEMLRQQHLRQQTESMQLLSIIQSDEGNCCMIDDKILYEGDSIRSFKVSQISDSFVKLVSEGVETILKLAE